MTKNDRAWRRFFDGTDALSRIGARGYCYVDAASLKQIGDREPRLMAKLDTLSARPSIFRKRDLTIFPVENGRYILFRDPDERSYFRLPTERDELPVQVYRSTVDLTTFDSYPGAERPSESQALDFAYVSSLIKTFTGEQDVYLTIRGRLFSGEFHFQLPVTEHLVTVSGVQIEVDAGYESPSAIYLIEAKVGKRDDFHIRQLYYPYLEWRQRSAKRIVPIFLVHSVGRYYFYEFAFSEQFGDLSLTRSACYAIDESPMAELDLDDLLAIPVLGAEPDVPYPQADDLDKVIDLIPLVADGTDTKAGIAEAFEFEERQGDYYANAASYLGFLSRGRRRFVLTELGQHFAQTRSTVRRTKMLARQIAARPTFHALLELLKERDVQLDSIRRAEIARTIQAYTNLSGTTFVRRAATVRSWLRWLLQNTTLGE
jgi:hypothetical protein